MKVFLFFILIFRAPFLIAQVVNDTTPIITVSAIGIDRIKAREEKIIVYADSINNYVSGVLPEFLFDKCFDLQSSLWSGFHSPISLRWKVLEKINNKEALKKILDAHDKRLKQKCSYDIGSNPEIIVPMIEKSFCNLIRKRYRQLKKEN